jgi:endonuclease III
MTIIELVRDTVKNYNISKFHDPRMKIVGAIVLTDRHTDRQTNRQTDRLTGRSTI